MRKILTVDDSSSIRQMVNFTLGKAGYEVVEMFEADMCCGMGGSYSLKLPEISAPILQRKLTNIANTGAAAHQTVFHAHVHVLGGRAIFRCLRITGASRLVAD